MTLGINDLVEWLRGFAPMTKAAEGQPDTVHENLTELAMWLGEVTDYMQIDKRTAHLRDLVAKHNADVRERCTRRRAEPVPCTGTLAAPCAECPRRSGLALYTRSVK